VTSLIIGVVIGATVGLTGAGGALIAIPLFMHFLALDFKHASLLSLVAVMMAAGLNLINQRSQVKWSVVAPIVLASIAGSLAGIGLKSYLPELALLLLLASISLYALYAVWNSTLTADLGPREISFWWGGLIGFTLGVLTTLTGLGGGVLMVPIMLQLYRLSMQQAVATGLAATGLSALLSFLFQFSSTGLPISLSITLRLALGIAGSALLLHLLLAKLPRPLLQRVRQIVLTAVVVFALGRLFVWQ